ncbi:hypothetical protein IMZ48_07805 [Candidatus Bathyarchaeota archaeon]|nr:hypothetical protein [Candidatus Bathyarchaeota archaeon]
MAVVVLAVAAGGDDGQLVGMAGSGGQLCDDIIVPSPSAPRKLPSSIHPVIPRGARLAVGLTPQRPIQDENSRGTLHGPTSHRIFG